MEKLVLPITWIYGSAFLVRAALGFVVAYEGMLFELFIVEDTRNLIYIGSGLLGLIAFFGGYAAARGYLIVLGMVYGIVALLGYLLEGDVLNIIQTNQADDYLHMGIAIVALVIGMMSPSQKHL